MAGMCELAMSHSIFVAGCTHVVLALRRNRIHKLLLPQIQLARFLIPHRILHELAPCLRRQIRRILRAYQALLHRIHHRRHDGELAALLLPSLTQRTYLASTTRLTPFRES
jgi:hypothetical protein